MSWSCGALELMTTDTPARLLRLLSLLQTPREWPGGELADRLGLSRRTIRRDIDRLRDIGYPVRTTLGPDGGYRLVSTERRWYLVAYDLDRADWRTFRVDRVSEPFATGARFTPRELPTGSAAEYLRQSMHRVQEPYDLDVTFAAPAEAVAARLPGRLGTPEPLDERSCRLRTTVDGPKDWTAVCLAMPGYDFTVREPEELVESVRELGDRMTRAAAGR